MSSYRLWEVSETRLWGIQSSHLSFSCQHAQIERLLEKRLKTRSSILISKLIYQYFLAECAVRRFGGGGGGSVPIYHSLRVFICVLLLSHFAILHHSSTMFLPWSQPIMNWKLWNHKPAKPLFPLMCGIFVPTMGKLTNISGFLWTTASAFCNISLCVFGRGTVLSYSLSHHWNTIPDTCNSKNGRSVSPCAAGLNTEIASCKGLRQRGKLLTLRCPGIRKKEGVQEGDIPFQVSDPSVLTSKSAISPPWLYHLPKVPTTSTWVLWGPFWI